MVALVRRVFVLPVLLLGFLAVCPGLSAQTATVYTTTSNNNILRVDFDAGTATTVNTDQTFRKALQGLAVLDDGLGGIKLLVADTGAILIYTKAPPPDPHFISAVITSAIPLPRGITLDQDKNLFVVSSGTGNATDRIRRVFKIRRDGSGVAGYNPMPILIDGAVPSEALEEPKIVPFTAGNLQKGDLLVVSSRPATVFRYSAAAPGSPEVFLPPTSFGSQAPNGISFAPDQSLLISTEGGTILRFLPDGQADPAQPVFFTGLGNGPVKIAVGVDRDPTPPGKIVNRAFLTQRNNGSVHQFEIQTDGTGKLEKTVTSGVQSPVGVDCTTCNAVPTPAGTNVTISPANVTDVNFLQEVTMAGLTHSRVFTFPDCRETDPGRCHEETLNLKVHIDESLPPVVIPPYVRAHRKGDIATGVPTFILVITDTTAFAEGLAELHGKEEAILGYDPPCNNPSDRMSEARWYYSPETGPPKSEDPIVEGSLFTDISSGCGSHLGLTKNFSLFLIARDTRRLDGLGNVDSSSDCTAANGIVDCKLNKLRQALNSFPCIGSSTKNDLNKILASAIRGFDLRNYAQAIKRLESFNSAVDSGDFTECEKKESDELKARGLSAIFMLRKLL